MLLRRKPVLVNSYRHPSSRFHWRRQSTSSTELYRASWRGIWEWHRRRLVVGLHQHGRNFDVPRTRSFGCWCADWYIFVQYTDDWRSCTPFDSTRLRRISHCSARSSSSRRAKVLICTQRKRKVGAYAWYQTRNLMSFLFLVSDLSKTGSWFIVNAVDWSMSVYMSSNVVTFYFYVRNSLQLFLLPISSH